MSVLKDVYAGSSKVKVIACSNVDHYFTGFGDAGP